MCVQEDSNVHDVLMGRWEKNNAIFLCCVCDLLPNVVALFLALATPKLATLFLIQKLVAQCCCLPAFYPCSQPWQPCFQPYFQPSNLPTFQNVNVLLPILFLVVVLFPTFPKTCCPISMLCCFQPSNLLTFQMLMFPFQMIPCFQPSQKLVVCVSLIKSLLPLDLFATMIPSFKHIVILSKNLLLQQLVVTFLLQHISYPTSKLLPLLQPPFAFMLYCQNSNCWKKAYGLAHQLQSAYAIYLPLPSHLQETRHY